MGASRTQATLRTCTRTRLHPGACLISVAVGGSVCRWTKDAEVVFGYPTERAEGLSIEQLLPFFRDDAPELEGWCRRVDGSVFRGLVAPLAAAEDSDLHRGAPSQVFVVTDITSRYMREQALSHVRERIDAVTSSVAHLAFFSIDYLRDDLEAWGAFGDVVGWAEQVPPRRVADLMRLVHPEDRPALTASFDRAVTSGTAFELELRVCPSAGERWVMLAGGVVDSQPPRIVCAGLNVTGQRVVGDALRTSEAKLRAVLAGTHEGVATIDASGAIVALNDAALAMFRAADARVLGAHYRELLDLGDEPLPDSGTLEEVIGRRLDGTTFTLECALTAIGHGEQRVTVAILREVTQRRALERQVLEASEQLQRQIGQDLHDGLGQLLTGTAFLAKGLQHGLPSEHQPQAQRIVELINLAIARVRSLARGLSPIHVEAESLETVLRATVSEASELLGVACRLEIVDFVDNAPPAAIAQLCLIAREAITNAVRHGHAQHIVVRLSRQGEQSVLSVEDDGVGIDELKKPLGGLGLRSMRYRAKMIDGKLDIVRNRSGTTVRCCWRDP